MSEQTEISFEDAMQELEQIVHTLETGKIKLDEAISVYERGMYLKKVCDVRLAAAKSKIDQLQIENATIVGATSFDAQIKSE